MLYCVMFFFFKQKTAYDMRISDWSSDVCSSDLARATYGSFNAYQLQGALNLPIITDVLGLRLVGGYAKSDGYMRNGYCYGPVVTFGPSKYAGVSGCGDGRRIGGTDVFSGRAKLLWEPNSDISAPNGSASCRESVCQ